MKQIERVSIGGYAFALEKEAAQAVAAYLKDMTACYPNPEIVEGIEERMAELLLERTPKDGVVTIDSVKQIILDSLRIKDIRSFILITMPVRHRHK